MQHYAVYFICKLLYMFRVVPSPIIRSANNCIYSIWYLSHRYCYLPISWKSWNWFEFLKSLTEYFELWVPLVGHDVIRQAYNRVNLP